MAAIRKLQVVFYQTDSGKEPVRDWLKELNKDDRKVIGEDIKTVQFGWPLGMPLVRKLEKGLWEVRIQLESRIARILFTSHNGTMVLLHGFIKKSQKTPTKDMKVAKQRMATIGGHHE
jgi:phage-related protein